MSEMGGLHWPAALTAAAAALGVAVAGGVMTEIGPWYASLRFPPWKPPNWAFGPIWTVILVLAALSGALAWGAAGSDAQRAGIVVLFAVNAVLNVVWNVLFFRWRRPDWALVETVFLWLSIAALMLFLWPISALASLLLAPYLVWVTIASVLNRAIVRLNAPFAGRAATRSV